MDSMPKTDDRKAVAKTLAAPNAVEVDRVSEQLCGTLTAGAEGVHSQSDSFEDADS